MLHRRAAAPPRAIGTGPAPAGWRWGAITLVATLTALLGAGCKPPPWKRPTQGVVETPGVEIRAEDGSFVLTGGKSFQPPFYARDCMAWAVWDNWTLALKWGARRVRVRVPGEPTPLYGVLSLCEVHPTRAGSAGESYRIKIPAVAPGLMKAGRPIVIVKETDYGLRFKDGYQRYDVWQLWLSRTPFPGPSPSKGPGPTPPR